MTDLNILLLLNTCQNTLISSNHYKKMNKTNLKIGNVAFSVFEKKNPCNADAKQLPYTFERPSFQGLENIRTNTRMRDQQ